MSDFYQVILSTNLLPKEMWKNLRPAKTVSSQKLNQ